MIEMYRHEMYPDRRPFNLVRIRHDQPWSFPLHRHMDYLEAVLIRKGRLEQRVNDAVVKSGPQQLLFMGVGTTHSIEGTAGDFYNLNFHPGELQRLLDFLDSESARSRPLFSEPGRWRLLELDEENQQVLQIMFEELLCLHDERYRPIYFKKILLRIVADCILHPKLQPRLHRLPGWLAGALSRTEEAFDPYWSVHDLARMAHCSPEHLSRSFRRHLDTTPSEYLNELRLNRAAMLLKNSNLEIREICDESGFRNLNYFHRLFKKRYGRSPRQYRGRNPMPPI